MPNRDDHNDPERKNPNPGREGPISPNLRAFLGQRRENLRRKADAILLRSTPEIIRAQAAFLEEVIRQSADLLSAAYARTLDQKPQPYGGLAYLGLEETPALKRRTHRRVDRDLVQFFRDTASRELARSSPNWSLIRGAFFSLAGVFHVGRDHGSAEYTLHQGLALVQKTFGEHSKPAIAFASKALAWLFGRGLFPAAARFAERTHFIMQGHLGPRDPRMAMIWLRMGDCYRLTDRYERAIVAALESWCVSLGRQGRAPDVFPLLCVARMQLALGHFAKTAEAASLLIKVAEAYGFAQTEHAHDARALLSEVT